MIQDEGTRIGHALRPAFGGLVADVVGVDRLAPGIGEQWEGDLHAVGEGLQDLRVVIADADELDTGILDGLEVALQLDQLRAAERSPVGRAVKHQGDLALVEEFVQRALLALLVLEGEPRRRCADLQAGLFLGRRLSLLLGPCGRRGEKQDHRGERRRSDQGCHLGSLRQERTGPS